MIAVLEHPPLSLALAALYQRRLEFAPTDLDAALPETPAGSVWLRLLEETTALVALYLNVGVCEEDRFTLLPPSGSDPLLDQLFQALDDLVKTPLWKYCYSPYCLRLSLRTRRGTLYLYYDSV